VQTRPLGATGLQVSALVFGAGAVGGAVFRGDREQRLETVRRALDAGINWIDTAPGYGDGQSEENLGWILPELGATPHVSTKVRLRPGDLRDIRGAVEQSLRASLARLRLPRVDLVQLHNPLGQTRDDARGRLSLEDVLGAGGVADALAAMRAAGLAGHVGFTALGDVDAIHEAVASGRFDTAQVYHNVLNPSATRPMPAAFSAEDYRELALACARNALGVLNIRVLAAGALGGQALRGGFAMSPGSEPERDARRAELAAHALQDEPGTLAQKAIRYALARPEISGVLVGFSTPGQVDEAVAATGMGTLDEVSLARLEALYESDFEGA
jgi:L-galactose dehydrogenase/L-glyceraldehyde 3-phosphate reductase